MAGGGGRSPFQITLRSSQRRWLKALVHRGTAEHRQVTRARIVLLAAAGWTNRGIARKLGLAPNTAGKWRKRFYKEGVDGLRDRKRPGRPRAFPAAVVAAAKAIACELPATRGVPLGRWSLAELRTELLATGLVGDVSTTTLWRWLNEDPIKPWQHRSWIFPRDPDFAAKAGVVLDLYDRVFQDQELELDAYVISADEKTSIQARCRCHPTLPPGVARTMRVEHEYQRGGALAYLAAWDVHQARLFGRCEPSTGIQPFGRLVEQVMASEPYASAARVFWIVDNGSSHRGQASIARLQAAWANLRLVHLPIHASWLNQVELYFSVVQRKVLTPNDFLDLAEVQRRLLAFQRRYQQTATSFDWRFTRADLDRLLRRLDEHQHRGTAA
ncbi:MAG: putative transposase [Actinomycetia bacterium]|nr:putative transposase [Actinomycetes bacterium]